MNQHTIKNKIEFKGTGLHSGKKVRMSLLPCAENAGIKFVRTDVSGYDSVIPANYKNVCQTSLGTCIANNDGTIISTVEHLMAALWACRVDNVIIEIEGPEVPIMDGSSAPFIERIEKAGVAEQLDQVVAFEILKEISIEDGDKKASVIPSKDFSVSLEIDFNHDAVAKQKAIFCGSRDVFKEEFSSARTFGFEEEVEYLKKNGFARGGSLDNAIVIGRKGILNKGGLRFNNELVKHKILDCIGDLYLAGGKLLASFSGYKSGHDLNNRLLRKIFSTEGAWRLA